MLSLSDSDRLSLLNLAREAVTEAVSRGELLSHIPSQGIFAEKRGVFVTLHVSGRLHGCIGVVEPLEPLGEAIVRCACSAALHDPRFPPVRADELPHLQVEISLLSTPSPIRVEDIEIGRQGLLVSRGQQRGLLLPQVAVEHGFTPEQFLRETCRKAQLSPDAWPAPDILLYGFTCEVFSDSDSPTEAG
jgi:uncharacterized protein